MYLSKQYHYWIEAERVNKDWCVLKNLKVLLAADLNGIFTPCDHPQRE
jgi:hypothetical protein